jgi:DNA-binding winged helix-turn-helix (wHTH) protein/tetratricopeptide (TPR) repeat protein
LAFSFADDMGATSVSRDGIRTFGPFTFDPKCGELTRNGYRVRLQPQPTVVLALLTDQPGKLILREEICRTVWGEDTHVDFEQSLNYCIRQIRSALRDDANEPEYVETVPKRGYRFLARVGIATANEAGLATGVGATAPAEIPNEAPDSSASSSASAAKVGTGAGRLWKIMVPAVSIVLALSVDGYLYFQRRPKLTNKDTIVLTDFANNTGDAIFDDTLRTALNVSLQQSPFLSVLSDSQVAKTLQEMTRPANTKLTPEVTRELCQRVGSKAYIAGSIGGLGSEYVLGLKAVNCENGDALAQEQITALSKEKVLDALGEAASKLRSQLGESLVTVQKFEVPLERATTSSFEALKAYSLAQKAYNEKGEPAALPYHQRALELDPDFAMAYWATGIDYSNLGELETARGYITKAFQLREHASEQEKLTITASYYFLATGELDKAAQALQEEIQSYPRAVRGYNLLDVVYGEEGQYEQAAEITRQSLRLKPDPDNVNAYNNLPFYALLLQRFDESRQIIREEQARKIDTRGMHYDLYALAFIGGDSAAMAEQQRWFAGKPDYENIGLALASDTEAYAGHLRKARELSARAVASALRTNSEETGAELQAIAAQREAAYGNTVEARRLVVEALKLTPASQAVEVEAGLTFATAGDTARAESLARDVNKRSPLDTQMQSLWLPAIQAQLALDRKNPVSALSALQAASPIELGQSNILNSPSCLYPTYIRGQAYLAAEQGSAAAAEFQKILDHNGIVWNCWTGALAHLGVARANAVQARTSQGVEADAARVRALASYEGFLTLWKDADPDIPILKQAKSEYAKLQ